MTLPFLCRYLFHYISQDGIVFLCITDDVSNQPFVDTISFRISWVILSPAHIVRLSMPS